MLVCGQPHMWRAGLSILLIAYIPGALMLRLPVGRRSLRAALPAEERLFWSTIISVALSSIVALGLAAGGAYRFDRLLWIEGGLSLALALVNRRHLVWRSEAPKPGWTAMFPAALVFVGCALFFSLQPASAWSLRQCPSSSSNRLSSGSESNSNELRSTSAVDS